MSGKNKAPAPRPPVVVVAGELARTIDVQHLLDLAQLWEEGADSLERQGFGAAMNGGNLGDLALGLVSGAASQVRADALRDAARQLREVIASPQVFTHEAFQRRKQG